MPKRRVRPFLNLHVAKRRARQHRLKAKGLTPPGDKASLRAAAELASQQHPIRHIPAGASKFTR